MKLELVAIPGLNPQYETKWKIRALVVEGRDPVRAALSRWAKECPSDYKAIMKVMRLAAQPGEQLDQSPSFRADYLKSLFVEKMLEAMTEAGTKQTEIAKCLGKTRQYVSKVLNEDRRINFTIETMCEFAHLVGRYVDIQVLRVNEVAHILRTVPAERCVLSLEEEFSRRKHDITRYAIPLEFKYDDTRSAA